MSCTREFSAFLVREVLSVFSTKDIPLLHHTVPQEDGDETVSQEINLPLILQSPPNAFAIIHFFFPSADTNCTRSGKGWPNIRCSPREERMLRRREVNDSMNVLTIYMCVWGKRMKYRKEIPFCFSCADKRHWKPHDFLSPENVSSLPVSPSGVRQERNPSCGRSGKKILHDSRRIFTDIRSFFDISSSMRRRACPAPNNSRGWD